MNLGAHVLVAAALGSDPVVHLGAALPDVATIGGFRMVPGAGSGAIGVGITLHHATDEAFHGHQWFLEHQKNVFESLIAAGVRRGAARASAHVGVELLLDGQLFDEGTDSGRSDLVHDAFATASSQPALVGLVPAPMRPDWLAHLASLHRWRSPTYFADPEAVASRLQQILSRRPRLAMQDNEVDRVSASLAAVQPAIVATAENFLSQLVGQLSAEPP